MVGWYVAVKSHSIFHYLPVQSSPVQKKNADLELFNFFTLVGRNMFRLGSNFNLKILNGVLPKFDLHLAWEEVKVGLLLPELLIDIVLVLQFTLIAGAPHILAMKS